MFHLWQVEYTWPPPQHNKFQSLVITAGYNLHELADEFYAKQSIEPDKIRIEKITYIGVFSRSDLPI